MGNRIRLSINYEYHPLANEVACYDIPEMSHDYESFSRPIEKITDNSFAERFLFRPTPEGEIRLIMKNRKEAAERISKMMVDFLLDQMSKKDTLDGHPVKETES